MTAAVAELCTLGLDEVVHRSGSRGDELLARPPLLEARLRTQASMNVAISSSWRNSRTLPHLRFLLTKDPRGRIDFMTDVHWRRAHAQTVDVPLTAAHERERGVVRWLAASQAPRRNRAAADGEYGNYAPSRRNVATREPHIGLTQQHLVGLDQVLDCDGE
jgi:hypothetical protein